MVTMNLEDETPIILSRKAEQELRAMATITFTTLEDILADFRTRYWIVPKDGIDPAIFKCGVDVQLRRVAVKSPSDHLEDLLYENLKGRLKAFALHKKIHERQ